MNANTEVLHEYREPKRIVGLTAIANRYAAPVKWLSVIVIALALIFMVRKLPLEQAVRMLHLWMDGLGWWGPLVLGVLYVAAAVLFIPGSALTMLAGVLFGPLWGTLTVSLASTMAAALAFLIARYLAREKVAKLARKNAKFGAVDQAISEGGWKIVALLRLTPVFPYGPGNYLLGLTAIRFWPYVLASWLFMLPGTFMFVYVAYAGREGLAAAAGASSRSVGDWVRLGVGLAATIAVTVYVTRLARKAIQERTKIQDQADEPEEAEAKPEELKPQGWPWGATVAGVLAVLAAGTAGFAYAHPNFLAFGPPVVKLAEAYEKNPAGPKFNHARFNELLRKHVDAEGGVDYGGLQKDAAKLDQYIAALGQAPFEKLGRDEKLAFLINAYNAFTLRLILDHWNGGKLDSIMNIPKAQRWAAVRWKIGRHTWSLNQIEHEQIRPKFKEPRVHFALVCAAVGCPKLRNEAYLAKRIEAQLADQAKYIHGHARWFRFDPKREALSLTQLYKWYGGDFEQVAGGSVLKFAARYAPALQKALAGGKKPAIEWLAYDWKLNSRKNVHRAK